MEKEIIIKEDEIIKIYDKKLFNTNNKYITLQDLININMNAKISKE